MGHWGRSRRRGVGVPHPTPRRLASLRTPAALHPPEPAWLVAARYAPLAVAATAPSSPLLVTPKRPSAPSRPSARRPLLVSASSVVRDTAAHGHAVRARMRCDGGSKRARTHPQLHVIRRHGHCVLRRLACVELLGHRRVGHELHEAKDRRRHVEQRLESKKHTSGTFMLLPDGLVR